MAWQNRQTRLHAQLWLLSFAHTPPRACIVDANVEDAFECPLSPYVENIRVGSRQTTNSPHDGRTEPLVNAEMPRDGPGCPVGNVGCCNLGKRRATSSGEAREGGSGSLFDMTGKRFS